MGQRVTGVGHAFLISVCQHGKLVVHLARLDKRVVPLPEMDVVDGQEDVQQHLFELLALIWQGVVRREKGLDFGPDAAGIEVLGQRLGGRQGLNAVSVAAG